MRSTFSVSFQQEKFVKNDFNNKNITMVPVALAKVARNVIDIGTETCFRK